MKSFVGGLVIGELCEKSSSSSMEKTLPEFLMAEKIRLAGTIKGIIVSEYTSQTTINEMMALPIVILNKRSIFGICLGHQILALAFGANTYKLITS